MTMFDNDHTDAEFARRELAYEMGEDTPEDRRWSKWVAQVEAKLIGLGWTSKQQGLDGDQDEDGFSLDFGHDAFEDGLTPDEYVDLVRYARNDMQKGA